MQFEQTQDRQRLNHVAERTGFEDENFQMRSRSRAQKARIEKRGNSAAVSQALRQAFRQF